MSFVHEWTPSAVKPNSDSLVTIKTWDGEDVPEASYSISGLSVRLEVPRSNKYRVSISSAAMSESVKLNIPARQNSNTIEDRMKNYTDKKIEESSGGGSVPGGLVRDPDNEGFYKIVNT